MIELARASFTQGVPDLIAPPFAIDGNAWIYNLVQRIEGYDDLRGHINRVARIATGVARARGVGREQLKDLEDGALLHDIGKLDLPEPLFYKKDLTPEERRVVENHVLIGYYKIHRMRPDAAGIMIWHHRFQKDGYPRNINWNTFNRFRDLGRDLFVADQIDARLTRRSYHEPQRADGVMSDITGLIGNPRLVDKAINLRLSIIQ